MAELADAHDSNSCSFGSVGSIPTFGTSRNSPGLYHEPFSLQEGLYLLEMEKIGIEGAFISGLTAWSSTCKGMLLSGQPCLDENPKSTLSGAF